jgi:hypothetical protein
MNRKQLGLLILVCVLIGVVGLILSKRRSEDWARAGQELGRELLPNLPVNDVAHIHIRSKDNQVNIRKTNDTWVVQERKNYPANAGEVTDALRKLVYLKVAEPMEISPDQLWRLNLLGPDKATNTGTTVELKDQAGKRLALLTVGKEFIKQSRSESPFGGGFPSGRYVMVGDDARKVALVSDTLSAFAPNPERWLSKDFFKVEKLKTASVTSTNATNNWTLTRETEGGEWKFADAKGDEKADSAKCSSLNWLLSNPTFNDLALDWQFNETNKPTTTATLQTFDNFTYTLKLAPKSGDDYYLQVAVTADIPKERTPTGTNETAEVKEKLDKEFKEKTDKLRDKLKAEKALEPWTYIVSKWTIDTLLKGRHEFLAEKKQEPKKEESQPAQPASQQAKAEPPAPKPGPAKAEPGPTAAKPPEAKPAETKPAQPQTAQTQPAQTSPAQTKPQTNAAASKPPESLADTLVPKLNQK